MVLVSNYLAFEIDYLVFFFFFGVKLSSFYFLLLIEYYHYSEANKRADRSVQKINLRCECTIYREKGIRKSF
jgi:NADH:ubiquinone oxidoreductase subunit 4 (subunit M)